MFREKRDGIVGDGIGVIVTFRLIVGVVDWRDVSVLATQGVWIVKAPCANDGSVKFSKPRCSGQLSFGPSGEVWVVTCHFPLM